MSSAWLNRRESEKIMENDEICDLRIKQKPDCRELQKSLCKRLIKGNVTFVKGRGVSHVQQRENWSLMWFTGTLRGVLFFFNFVLHWSIAD